MFKRPSLLPLPLVFAMAGPTLAQTPVWIPGVTVQLFDIQEGMDRYYELVPNQTPNLDEARPTIDFGNGAFLDPISATPFQAYFLVKVFGEIEAPVAGTYQFALESDDGSLLWLDDNLVVDNDGTHGAETVTGSVTLTSGWHQLDIGAFNDIGDFFLQLRWKKPGDASFTVVPSSALRTDNNVVRVTAPGKKYILNSGDLRPGTGLPLDGVHPAWILETIRPAGFEPQVGAMAVADASTLYLATFRPNQDDSVVFDAQARLWRVDGIDGLPSGVTATQVAGFGLPGSVQIDETTGMEWVNGELFIAERTGVYRVIDDNTDGLFEAKELIGDSWAWDSFHQFAFCLKHRAEADGDYLYGALSVAIALGGLSDANRADHNGCVYRLKIPPRGAGPNPVDYLAGGFRTPNGVGFGPNGEVLVTDNQGGWNPANSLTHAVSGSFFGHYNPTNLFPPPPYTPVPGRFESQPVSPKSVYFPHNEVANSPTDILTLASGDFAGQLLVGELTAGGVRRVFLEEVEGATQGAVFRFSQGFEGGVHRLRQAPDGSIVVGCMGSNGSWSYQGLTNGLQRLRPKSAPPAVFEIKAIRALATGIDIQFTDPVPLPLLQHAPSFLVEQWRYIPTDSYGGPKIDHETVTVISTTPSPDRRSVQLELPDMKAGHVLYLRTGVRSDAQDELWSGEAWYTMNQIPGGASTGGGNPGGGTTPSPQVTRLELEDGTMGGDAAPESDEPGFSGTGFVAHWDNAGSIETVTVTYDVAWTGDHELVIRYARGQWSGVGTLTADGLVEVLVDGTQVGQVTLLTQEFWTTWVSSTPLIVPLAAGPHQITLRNPDANDKQLGVANFDYLEITAPEPPAIPEIVMALDALHPTAPWAIALVGDDLQVRFDTYPSTTNTLWFSPDLVNWSPILTLPGNGSIQSATIPGFGTGLLQAFLMLEISATP